MRNLLNRWAETGAFGTIRVLGYRLTLAPARFLTALPAGSIQLSQQTPGYRYGIGGKLAAPKLRVLVVWEC